MEITRRHFGISLLALVAVTCTGAWKFAVKQTRGRWVRAEKPSSFPGKLTTFDPDTTSRPGPWSG